MKLYSSRYSRLYGNNQNSRGCFCRNLRPDAVIAGVAPETASGTESCDRFLSQILRPDHSGQPLSENELLLYFLKQEDGDLRGTAASSGVILSICGDKASWARNGVAQLHYFHNGKPQRLRQEDRQPSDGSGPDDRCQASSVTSVAVTLKPGHHEFLLCTNNFRSSISDTEIWLDLLKSQSPDAWLTYLVCRNETKRETSDPSSTAVALWVEI